MPTVSAVHHMIKLFTSYMNYGIAWPLSLRDFHPFRTAEYLTIHISSYMQTTQTISAIGKLCIRFGWAKSQIVLVVHKGIDFVLEGIVSLISNFFDCVHYLCYIIYNVNGCKYQYTIILCRILFL